MKLRLIFTAMVLCFGLAAGQTTKSGTISSNETWSGTVTITGNVTIQNAVVIIQPGTEVRLQSGLGIAIRTNGGIWAVGTAASPVLFTSPYTTKTAGVWAEIDLFENINVAQTTFRHCIFECGNTMLDFRSSDHDRIRATSAITIEDCIFRKSGTSAVYITSGGNPTMRRCSFEDCKSSGVFGHGAGTVTMEYCTISDCSVGIICSGEPSWGWNQVMNLDHLTIHNIRGAKATSEKWWTGMGIYCSGDSRQRGTMTLTNSILTDIEWPGKYCAGLQIGAWTCNNDYNCWYRAGVRDIDGGDYGSHAVEADPQFAEDGNPDLGLLGSSPCIGTADDGKNIGASQLVSSGITGHGAAAGTPLVSRTGRSLTVRNSAALLTMYGPDGKRIAVITPVDGVASWGGDGQTGVYLFRAGSLTGTFTVTD